MGSFAEKTAGWSSGSSVAYATGRRFESSSRLRTAGFGVASPPIEVNVADDLDNTIRESASGPAKAAVDGISVEQHPLSDQIAVDKHLGAKAAGRNPAKALTRMKIVPSGAV